MQKVTWNFLITGEAGCGKTYCLNAIKDKLIFNKKLKVKGFLKHEILHF